MPEYIIKIKTDVTLARPALDRMEDVVYDVLTKEKGASTATYFDGVGITDVYTAYN